MFLYVSMCVIACACMCLNKRVQPRLCALVRACTHVKTRPLWLDDDQTTHYVCVFSSTVRIGFGITDNPVGRAVNSAN